VTYPYLRKHNFPPLRGSSFADIRTQRSCGILKDSRQAGALAQPQPSYGGEASVVSVLSVVNRSPFMPAV
jgi:hypothetical protein